MMRAITVSTILFTVGFSATIYGEAGDVRFYEEDGVTYRETRVRVRRPVSETRYEERQETVYRPRYTTDIRDATQTYYAPVTRYQWEARWHGWWNPFQDPYVAYHLVPYTYWQTRQQTIQVPQTKSEWVPETRTVRKPITTLRFVEKEEVSRVAVNPQPRRSTASSAPAVAQGVQKPIGGVARLEGDPPRHGTGDVVGPWQGRR